MHIKTSSPAIPFTAKKFPSQIFTICPWKCLKSTLRTIHYPLSRCVFILKDVQMNKFDYYTFKSFEKGGWWGFTTSSEVTTWKVGKFSTKVLDSGTNSSRDHIHLYNASEIIRNRKLLGDLFEMTWRWVYMQYNSQYNWSLLYYTRSNGNADNLPLFNCRCLC